MTVRVDDALLRAWPLPDISADADKEARGRVLVVGGDDEVVGAAVLAGRAALRVGAGKLRIVVSPAAVAAVAVAMPEARVYAWTDAIDLPGLAAAVDAVVIGPGIVDERRGAYAVASVSPTEGPSVVIDAAALFALDDHTAAGLGGRVVLTPNAIEMQRLGSDGPALARRLDAVVSVKGPRTVTFTPGGEAYDDVSGNAGLATSGSGDVLAGVVGGLLARGASPAQAAVWASALHGLAGERLAGRVGPVGFLAHELVDELPGVLATLC